MQRLWSWSLWLTALLFPLSLGNEKLWQMVLLLLCPSWSCKSAVLWSLPSKSTLKELFDQLKIQLFNYSSLLQHEGSLVCCPGCCSGDADVKVNPFLGQQRGMRFPCPDKCVSSSKLLQHGHPSYQPTQQGKQSKTKFVAEAHYWVVNGAPVLLHFLCPLFRYTLNSISTTCSRSMTVTLVSPSPSTLTSNGRSHDWNSTQAFSWSTG